MVFPGPPLASETKCGGSKIPPRLLYVLRIRVYLRRADRKSKKQNNRKNPQQEYFHPSPP